MSESEQLSEPARPDFASRPDSGNPVEPALLAYQQHNRRAMRLYAAVLAVVVLLVFGGVRLAYAHGELDKVSRVSAAAPAPIPVGSTGSALAQRWHSSDRPAGGNPYAAGIVVSYDSHTVNGRDAITGAVRWHYTRSDQTICSVLQQDSSTIAIYHRQGNCDEVTGFVTATGAVKWYRTLTDNGRTSSASGPNVVLTVAAHSVHVFDNAGGLDRWNWVAPDGCSVNRALAGGQGVLIAMDCGSVHHLVLRDLTNDSQKWSITVANPMAPVAAGALVGALDLVTGDLHRFTADKGADTRTARLLPPAAVAGAAAHLPRAATTVDTTDPQGQPVEFVWLDSLLALSATGTVRWTAPASGPPWVIGTDLVASSLGGHTVLRQLADGRQQRSVSLSPAPSGTFRGYPVGTGLLVASDETAMYQ
ncbi:outer membrane protein assembly factor BamB family protein [Jatrophihabitans lederbergiae]|uniref:Pyrrolo-quinoline quinone repeat domain-containing protein n=1 Tax=Jatrophihabitans lederbergiae TaxID=3075547 RepID=A0ABU2J6B4_9ACTN|nr:PQQ-binding-like beta-propeller repeat protein [Jatrophihabitans sp. DSM 44399]MDT0260536.1 hypothetical protein [Jatrophihabitans sp. DSM 44399]